MAQETTLSTLSLAIMGLISQQPQTGYDLRKVFLTTPMGHFSSSPGAVYPALRRIEQAGWVRGRAGRSKTRRQRMLYELTAKGRKVLKQHLSRPVTGDDVVWHMDDLMLRFGFMDPIVGRERTLRFLRDFADRLDAHVVELRQYFDAAQDTLPPCGKLAMESGIESYEMNARWARRAIKELQSSS